MEVAPVDQGDIDRGVPEHPGGVESGEPAADDDHLLTGFRRVWHIYPAIASDEADGSGRCGASDPSPPLRPSHVIS